MLLTDLFEACSVRSLTQFRTTCPGMTRPHSGLCPPVPIINQEKQPTELPTGQSDRGIFFSFDIPSFQMSLACVTLATKQPTQAVLRKELGADAEAEADLTAVSNETQC